MRVILLSAFLLFVSSPTSPLPRIPASPPTITDLAWLEGAWSGEVGDRNFEAHYTGPDGGQILSASKYTKAGQPAGFEFERFEQRGDTLVVTPYPEGNSSVSFPVAEYDPKSRRVVFENLGHDFPTRISYQRVAKDRLTILVSGPGEDGNEQVLTYALRRK
jgi:Domain of unknown function (DUF6265)